MGEVEPVRPRPRTWCGVPGTTARPPPPRTPSPAPPWVGSGHPPRSSDSNTAWRRRLPYGQWVAARLMWQVREQQPVAPLNGPRSHCSPAVTSTQAVGATTGQAVRAAWHSKTQDLAEQSSPGAQAWPQVPQFRLSEARATHSPPHGAEAPAHGGLLVTATGCRSLAGGRPRATTPVATPRPSRTPGWPSRRRARGRPRPRCRYPGGPW